MIDREIFKKLYQQRCSLQSIKQEIDSSDDIAKTLEQQKCYEHLIRLINSSENWDNNAYSAYNNVLCEKRTSMVFSAEEDIQAIIDYCTELSGNIDTYKDKFNKLAKDMASKADTADNRSEEEINNDLRKLKSARSKLFEMIKIIKKAEDKFRKRHPYKDCTYTNSEIYLELQRIYRLTDPSKQMDPRSVLDLIKPQYGNLVNFTQDVLSTDFIDKLDTYLAKKEEKFSPQNNENQKLIEIQAIRKKLPEEVYCSQRFMTERLSLKPSEQQAVDTGCVTEEAGAVAKREVDFVSKNSFQFFSKQHTCAKKNALTKHSNKWIIFGKDFTAIKQFFFKTGTQKKFENFAAKAEKIEKKCERLSQLSI